MAVKVYKPTSPGRRFVTTSTFEEITKKEPEKSLLVKIEKSFGRNHFGRITAWHRGGGHKRLYRLIDFKRDKFGVPGIVEAIEYDPNRSARIALIKYKDGERRYIIAPLGLSVGDEVMSGPEAEIKPGNALPLKNIPVGTMVYNIEFKIGKGGQIARSAGAFAQIMGKEEGYALIKMPSGELRKININCMATVGQVGNLDHENISIGKAGRSRWLGKRPHVRGVAMNPIDHPLGGGEGKSSGGRHPCSPWGQLAKGLKTRRNKRTSVYIVKRRK